MNECLTTPQHEKQIGYWVSEKGKYPEVECYIHKCLNDIRILKFKPSRKCNLTCFFGFFKTIFYFHIIGKWDRRTGQAYINAFPLHDGMSQFHKNGLNITIDNIKKTNERSSWCTKSYIFPIRTAVEYVICT